jgi:hypothetical protein
VKKLQYRAAFPVVLVLLGAAWPTMACSGTGADGDTNPSTDAGTSGSVGADASGGDDGGGGGGGEGGSTSDGGASDGGPGSPDGGARTCGKTTAPTTCAVTSFSLGAAALHAALPAQSEEGLAAADMNCDGKADLVVGNYPSSPSASSSVGILTSKGDGTFGPDTAAYPVELTDFGEAVQVVSAGDLNGDGWPDVLTSANVIGSPPTVLLGGGDGTLGMASAANVNVGGNFLTGIVDINGDGKADVLAQSADGFSASLNGGAASFSGSVDYALATGRPIGLAIGDFNGDKAPDVALTNGQGAVVVSLNNGHGTFGALTPITLGVTSDLSWPLAAGDIDGDGVADLAAAEGSSLYIVLARGDGTFKTATTVPLTNDFQRAASVVVADFNGDGRADVAVGDAQSSLVLLFMAGSGGALGSAIPVNSGTGNSVMVAGDFLGTGVLGLATEDLDNVSVLLGSCQ